MTGPKISAPDPKIGLLFLEGEGSFPRLQIWENAQKIGCSEKTPRYPPKKTRLVEIRNSFFSMKVSIHGTEHDLVSSPLQGLIVSLVGSTLASGESSNWTVEFGIHKPLIAQPVLKTTGEFDWSMWSIAVSRYVGNLWSVFHNPKNGDSDVPVSDLDRDSPRKNQSVSPAWFSIKKI